MNDQNNQGEPQGSKFKSDFSQIQQDLNKLRDDFSELISSLVDVSKTGAGSARERIDVGLQEIKRKMNAAREQSGQVLGAAKQKIQERPIVSLLIALGVGLLIGKLMDRGES